MRVGAKKLLFLTCHAAILLEMPEIKMAMCSTEWRQYQPPREREPDAAVGGRHVESSAHRPAAGRRQLRAGRVGRALVLHALPHAQRDDTDSTGGGSAKGLLRHLSDTCVGRQRRQCAPQLLTK